METSSDTCPPVTPSGCLSAELARELKQDWPQPARYGKWVDGDGGLAQFVNQVNKTVSSASGWLRCLGVVVATITRRQKSLILIRAREVATNLSVPVSLLDAEGNLVFFNQAAEAMHGVTFEEVGELAAAEWPNSSPRLGSRSCRWASRCSSVGRAHHRPLHGCRWRRPECRRDRLSARRPRG